MRKKTSFVRILSKSAMWQALVLFVLFFAYMLITYRATKEDILISSENYVASLGGQMDRRIDGMQKMLERFLYDNTDLRLLQMSDTTKRTYAAIRLKQTMNSIMNLDDNAEYLIVAVPKYEVCLDATNISSVLEERNSLESYLKELANDDHNYVSEWNVRQIGSQKYMQKVSVQKGCSVGVFLRVSSLTASLEEDNGRSHFIFTDAEGMILDEKGAAGEYNKYEELGRFSRFSLENSCSIQDGQFYLYLYHPVTVILEQIRYGAVLFGLTLLLLAVFTVFLKKMIQRELTDPMQKLVKDMEKIQQGDYDLRIHTQSKASEFYVLTATFNQLMDRIINLKVRFYEKKLELQEADQKYIRLQLRPHFFLNAMTTVSSLSMQGKNSEIEKYIQTLSKNIRYMFSSGIHTVAVKDEIRHVQNYLEMQEIKYPGCIFSYIQLPEELEDWPVPQMLIHTLVENEYRYVVSPDSTRMLLIRVSDELWDGERMLKIEVEDDGDGYPGEVLEYMNGEGANHSSDGSRVGLWSLRRLLELMYERKGLMKLSNGSPHGALCRIYIPKTVVHEVGKEKGSESILAGEGKV